MRVSNRNVLGTLLHLTRFYSLRLPKLLDLIKRLIKMLKVILVNLIHQILGLDFNKTIYTKLKPKKLFPSLIKFNHKTI